VDQLERLQHALADRYDLERELGRGGMATVYLAQDLKHDRRVALHVYLGGARRFKEVAREGIEPPTRGFSGRQRSIAPGLFRTISGRPAMT
jgi:serine/threonine protein kinase